MANTIETGTDSNAQNNPDRQRNKRYPLGSLAVMRDEESYTVKQPAQTQESANSMKANSFPGFPSKL